MSFSRARISEITPLDIPCLPRFISSFGEGEATELSQKNWHFPRCPDYEPYLEDHPRTDVSS